MENGLSGCGCGKWIVESGKWKVESGAVPDLTYVKRRKIIAKSTVLPWHSGYVFVLFVSLSRGSNPGECYNFFKLFFQLFFQSLL